MFYLLHCTLCDHEWQATEPGEDCDWCGAPSYILIIPEDVDPDEIFDPCGIAGRR